MSGELDDPDNDPDRTTSTGDWWQGAPPTGSPWESRPGHPVQPPARPNPGQPHQNSPYGPQTGPPGSLPRSGANPLQSGPNPQSGVNPYQSGPNSQIGMNPVRAGQNPYSTGPSAFQTAPPGGQPPYSNGLPPSTGGGRGRVWLLSGIGALVVAIAVVVAVVIVVRNPSPAPTPVAKPSTTAPATTSPAASTTAPASTLTPEIPGYQVVVPANLKAAWDVPKDWVVAQSSTTTFGTASDNVAAAGTVQEGIEYCPDNVRTTMFLSTSTNSDANGAAMEIGAHVARLGWSTGGAITPGTAAPLTSTDGTLHGTFLETTGTFTATAGCANTFSVYTFAISVGDNKGSLVLTIAADTGVDRSVNPDYARKLLATFRLL